MSGLANTGRRMTNTLRGKGYMTERERKAKKTAKRQKKKDAIFHSAQMPDEELIKRNERRKAAARAGSRTSTVLTDREDMLG